LAGHVRNVFAAAVADPERSAVELPLLAPAERHQLIAEWNDTEAAEEAGVVEWFAAQAARTPQAVALVCGEHRLTYGPPALRAGPLAGRLAALGVGPGVPVGLFAERSPDMIVGLLGILAAGGAYLPLDPSYPRPRIAFLLEDSAAPVLVTQRSLAADLPP